MCTFPGSDAAHQSKEQREAEQAARWVSTFRSQGCVELVERSQGHTRVLELCENDLWLARVATPADIANKRQQVTKAQGDEANRITARRYQSWVDRGCPDSEPWWIKPPARSP